MDKNPQNYQKNCTLCPRNCNIDRKTARGVCGAPDEIIISKVMLHKWEEPCISGKNGSGAIFFSGCPLKCVYCQNKKISHTCAGNSVSTEELANIMLDLQARGAHNINLVTPTHYIDKIADALSSIKGELEIPVVYNTSGYESVDSLLKIADHVSIFLTDIKYFSSESSQKYSRASDYYSVAKEAFGAMLKIAGEPKYDKNGMMTRGVILRHLVLPSLRRDSIAIFEDIAKDFDISSFVLSLMSQYTPEFCDGDYPELARRLTTFEYSSVLARVTELGYTGYMQDFSSSTSAYTPDFN
ncbi:MAG: radical SAM protein [Clostridia bacterium]|nr:radical SAM protein [Clostridia bacterium]